MMIKLLSTIVKHANVFIVIIILITIFFGINASKIDIDSDYFSLFPNKNERSEELFRQTGITDSLEMRLYFSAELKGEMTLSKLRTFYDVVKNVENHENVFSSITPFNFITFKKNGNRLLVEPLAKDLPSTKAELAVFMDRLLSEPMADGFLTVDGGKLLSAVFATKRNLNPAEFISEFEHILEPLEKDFKVYYSGDIPFANKTENYIHKDLISLVTLAVLVILLVFFISFRAKRAVLLPFITVCIGAVWALGFSALIGFKITIVSVVLPTIVLAIGSSYAIHILSEYFREFGQYGNNLDSDVEICLAVSHVMKTVILAGITTIIGFFSLFFTSISPVKEFGVSVSFGILSCVLLSLFFLPALLSKLSPPQAVSRMKISGGPLNRIVMWLGRIVVKYYHLFIIIFILSMLLTIFLYPEISRKVDYIDYFPPNDRIVTDTFTIIEKTGGWQSLNITLVGPTGEDRFFLQPEVMKKVVKLEDDISRNANVMSQMSFYTILEEINGVMFQSDGLPENPGLILLLSRYFKLMGDRDITFASDADFINNDYSQITLFLKVFDSETGRMIADRDIYNLTEDLRSIVSESFSDSCETYIWGNTILFYESGVQIQKDQLFSTTLSMILIVLVSMIFLKSFLLGFFALIPLIFAIAFNYILMVLLNIPLDVTTVLVSNVAIGVGVDDAIHFLLQYQKQMLVCNGDCKTAVSSTFRITGRPIVLTTFSIVAGLSILCFASFKPIVYFGLLVSISLTAAMISTLLFLPAFILLYNRIKIPFVKSE